MYVDNAATTPIDEQVKLAMQPFLSENFANPGSPHKMGKTAKRAVEEARSRVANILSCYGDEIVFTGSATESVNLAIKGVAFAKGKGHIITSAAEHHCVLETCKYLESIGFDVTYLPVDSHGLVDATVLSQAIREDTILVSLIYASNEIGSINDIKSLAKVCKDKDVLFHTDACQAGALELDVNTLGVDLLTLNGSKIYGPKGVGVLYKRDGVKLVPLIHGGDQEHSLRAGTQNVAAIVGFAKALELYRELDHSGLSALRDDLIAKLLHIPGTVLNGHPTQRVAANVNVTFSDIDGSALLEMLDEEGIHASMGSACTSYVLEPSHVILAIGTPADQAHGALRFTLGKNTTQEDVDMLSETLSRLVTNLRAKNPVSIKS